MSMLLQRTMTMWAIAVVILPHSPAFAEEATPGSPVSIIETAPSTAATAPADVPGVIVFHARSSGLNYKLDVRDPVPLPEEFRFDFAHRPAPSTGIRLTPVAGVNRGGWAFSGRAGPVRWLTPITSEGSTVMRFGGRVPDQPRTPGLGNFNLSIHYAFE
jgi:hypothetical protein